MVRFATSDRIRKECQSPADLPTDIYHQRDIVQRRPERPKQRMGQLPPAVPAADHSGTAFLAQHPRGDVSPEWVNSLTPDSFFAPVSEGLLLVGCAEVAQRPTAHHWCAACVS
jgi:hypothetical protein